MLRLVRKLRAFGRLDRQRRAAVIRALPAAVAVEVGLRTVPLFRLARFLGVPVATSPEPAGTVECVAPPRDFDACAFAANALYRDRPESGRCLRRCLLAGYLMRHWQPRLRIGARRSEGRIEAHAWLELDGARLDLELHATRSGVSPGSAARFSPLRHAGA